MKNIVFVENKLAATSYKIAKALKRKGYATTLVSLSSVDNRFAKEAFDNIIVHEFKVNPSPKGIFNFISSINGKETKNLLNKIKSTNPYLVQVRGPSIETAVLLYLLKEYPRIFNLQDIWSYYSKGISFKKGSGRMQFINSISEKLSIKFSDGILNRSGENSLSYKKLNVPILDFLPFCLNEWNIPLKKKNIKKKNISLVYAGTVWDKWKGHASFPLMIEKIVAQGFDFHLYPSNELPKELDNKLKVISRSNKNFHLHKRADPDKINEEISKYDYALHLDFYDSSINPLWYKTGMSAKIFGYMEAGLPIIINKQFRNMHNIIESNSIGFGINYEDLDNLMAKIKYYKYPSKEDFIKARKKYDVDLNAQKLMAFYNKIKKISGK